jgi:two-component system LytT family response regulator
MINAIVIDDEVHCQKFLKILLDQHCPEIRVVGLCGSGEQGYASIQHHQPDLVFLDIEMPGMNGFELLEKFTQIRFSVIFTTGYDQYAIKAFHFSALDYLLKPIDAEELKHAVKKISQRQFLPDAEQFAWVLQKLQGKKEGFNKIAIPTSEGFELVEINEILYFESSNTYTHVMRRGRPRMTACRTLKEIEEQVRDFPFMLRVHNSYIVNLNEVSKYIRGEGGYLVMSNGATVNVSRSRKENLLRYF